MKNKEHRDTQSLHRGTQRKTKKSLFLSVNLWDSSVLSV